MSALVSEAREWRKTALPPTPWGDSHIVLRLADEVERLGDIIERAHHESIAGDGRSSVVLAVVREILAEGVDK